MFFRYDSRSHLIVYAWVNDQRTLRNTAAGVIPAKVGIELCPLYLADLTRRRKPANQ
jgi:hypothetical protein